jgi:hypothetical protein
MSLLPADTPRLPKWPFFAGDVLLLGFAFLIDRYAHNPFAGKPFILIFACIALGAVLAVVPFILDYARQQDEALDERQRGLEALAQTITASAEQISIATQSLPGIAETAAKNLDLAKQLPARLQEKTGESERLEASAGHLRQAAAELAKLETAAQKKFANARDELDVKAAQIFKQLDAKIALLAALAEKLSAAAAPSTAEKPARTHARPELVERARKEPEPPPGEPEAIPSVVAEKPASAETARGEPVEPMVIETPAEESKAPRKRAPARKEPEAPPGEPAEAVEGPTEQAEPAAVLPAAEETPATVEAVATETPAEDLKTPRKRAPKKPKSESVEPALDFAASAENTVSPSAVSSPPASTGGDEFSQPSPDETAPTSAVSADGATRLLVTAYIGIGNKLFLRGDGPGLSWDEGVPLQFVSIGKWRWETPDATGPVRAKLYKNDETECAALGELTLDPGRQSEVTAAF